MSYTALDRVGFNPTHVDAGGRLRVSQLTTLFDGKALNGDLSYKWTNVGTGTFNFTQNMMGMSVTAGQYAIRQANHVNPYFSGKGQTVEVTFDNFQPQAGVIKRAGYFSSNAVAPYASNLDGFWLESDGDAVAGQDISLVIYNYGTQKAKIHWEDWNAYSTISGYDWQNFTVAEMRFLWLGGTTIGLFLVFRGVLLLVHTFVYAGTSQGVMLRSPNQPMRYEIRSTTGVGSMNAICCQVSTEGSVEEQGDAVSVFNSPASAIAANAVGTTYAIRGIRKQVANRDIHVDITEFGGNIITSGNVDAGRFLLLLSPGLSAPLVYTSLGRIEDGAATTQTVLSLGRVIGAVEAVGSGASSDFVDNYFRSLLNDINDTMFEVVLAYQPHTTNQSVHGHISAKEN